jgi:hypothetical protein
MKFKLKKEFENSQIFCKDKHGNEILITAKDFNDYFAELMLANNQGHLVELNPMYEEMLTDEKKTFQQVTEGVIALTYEPLPSDLQPQKEMPKKKASNSKGGKQPTQKG